ncbi:prenylcysteine oxidase 1 isoform X2 [Ascaphus truei]
MYMWVEDVLEKFMRIYRYQTFDYCFSSTETLLHALGGNDFTEKLNMTIDETMQKAGFSQMFIDEIVAPAMRANYGQGVRVNGFVGRTSAASKKEMWDTIVIGVNACGNSVRDKYHCRKRFDDIRSKLKKKIQDQRVHATGTGGGPTPQRLILTPLEELLRPKLLTVVVEGLAGDRDIGIYPSQFPAVAPGGHVSPEMEQVSSPGSASSTLLEEHHGDEDDEYDEDDATEETEIQSCDHEEVPIETVVPPNRPSTSTYDAIVASEGKIVDAENRRHSDMMTVLERMIGLQEETVSQLAHLHRVFIEVPKQLQKINTSFEALVVQQTQANYWRMTNVPQFNTSQPGSVHAGQFSPHSSDIHSPGPNVTGQVADIAVQVPDDILPLPSVQIQQQTPTKEATKTKQDTHETDQPSLVQCLPTCSHVSLGTSPVREQSLPKIPVGESLPKSPVGESLPKSPVGESLPKSPVGESLPKSPVGESLPKSPVGESLPKSPVGESLATSPVGESLATSPVGEQSLATSPAREVPEATQSGSVVPKVGGKRKRKIQETTSRPVTRSQKEQKK